jgi:2-polyprenyl-3-methyl-5-hydroxy-6-metoxy-1,4-benzoquinol methylase
MKTIASGIEASAYGVPGVLPELKCNACGSKLTNPRRIQGFGINRKGKSVLAPWFRCGVCDSYFCAIDSNEQDEVAHHKTREHGRLARFEHCRELKRPLYQYVCREMTKRGLAGGDVLDVGASFGGFTSEAHAAGFKSSAMDINPDCVDYLQTIGFEAFQAASLSDLSRKGSRFDAVTMLDVQYYFKDQAAEFESARELLKPGGWLVVRTTNKLWAVRLCIILSKVFAAKAQSLFSRTVLDHAFIQSGGSLKRILQECGFQEVSLEPDRTHVIDVRWDTQALYGIGRVISKIAGRTVLVPGIIVWARHP